MLSKSLTVASLACAALLVAGCDRPQNDSMARNDTATPSSNAPPPIVAPAPPSSMPSAGAPKSADATAPGTKVADALSDTTLTAKVKTALVAEPGLQSTAIEVSTKDAVVTLTGTVESSTDRAKARMVAENVQGVRNVVDNLTLKS